MCAAIAAGQRQQQQQPLSIHTILFWKPQKANTISNKGEKRDKQQGQHAQVFFCNVPNFFLSLSLDILNQLYITFVLEQNRNTFYGALKIIIISHSDSGELFLGECLPHLHLAFRRFWESSKSPLAAETSFRKLPVTKYGRAFSGGVFSRKWFSFRLGMRSFKMHFRLAFNFGMKYSFG